MKVTVKVRPRSSSERVETIYEGEYKIWVKEPAEKGLANKAVKKALAKELEIAPSRVNLVSGNTFSKKIFEII